MPSARGADAIADAAWSGPLDLDNDPATFAAVPRRREERLPVRVVAAGLVTLQLSVAAPPVDPAAVENYAFRPGNMDGDPADPAQRLVEATWWSFRWD